MHHFIKVHYMPIFVHHTNQKLSRRLLSETKEIMSPTIYICHWMETIVSYRKMGS